MICCYCSRRPQVVLRARVCDHARMMVGREVTRRKSEAKGRRTQAERSASTKAHILETTFECLAEVGFAGTTTVLICERGNISRGALLHHYSTKTALVSATVEYVFERRLTAFRDAIINLPSGVDRREVAVDLLWEQFSSRTFYVWLELLVAARTDEMKFMRDLDAWYVVLPKSLTPGTRHPSPLG